MSMDLQNKSLNGTWFVIICTCMHVMHVKLNTATPIIVPNKGSRSKDWHLANPVHREPVNAKFDVFHYFSYFLVANFTHVAKLRYRRFDISQELLILFETKLWKCCIKSANLPRCRPGSTFDQDDTWAVNILYLTNVKMWHLLRQKLIFSSFKCPYMELVGVASWHLWPIVCEKKWLTVTHLHVEWIFCLYFKRRSPILC